MPKIGPGEILTKVLAVGICAGDAKCYAGAMLFWGKELHMGCFIFFIFKGVCESST